jgi:hypothetical protein
VLESFRRAAKFLVLLLVAVAAVAVARRLMGGRGSSSAPADRAPSSAPTAPRPIRLPATDVGADIEIETVAGEHVVGGVETQAADAEAAEVADTQTADTQAADTQTADTTVPWWVAPEGDACPTSHPVKVKQSSGIYHVPGGFNYERTKPDRCYLSPAAAQNDGYRASKR